MSSQWPIIVLSLPTATQRRVDITAQFAALDLPFVFFDAIDGRSGIPPQCEADIDRPGTIARHGYGMTDPEYACALSHQSIYRHVLDHGFPGAVILEDDAILTQRFRNFYLERAYERGDLIQLFYFNGTVWRHSEKTAAGLRLERLSANAWAAVGYSVSAGAAASLRLHSLPIRARADWPCATFQLFNHYVATPRPVLHPIPVAQQSTVAKDGTLPKGFDFSAGYAKGWRRLFSPASWRRLLRRPFTRVLDPGFAPSSEETSQIVLDQHRRAFAASTPSAE